MADALNRKKLFISYRTSDKKFTDLLVYYLRVYEVRWEMDIWVDDRIDSDIKKKKNENTNNNDDEFIELVDEQVDWEIGNAEMAVILLSDEYFKGFKSDSYVSYEQGLLRRVKRKNKTKIITVLISHISEEFNEQYEKVKKLFGDPINPGSPLPEGADIFRIYKYMRPLAAKIFSHIQSEKTKKHQYRSYRHYALRKIKQDSSQDLNKTIQSGLYATLSLGFHHLNRHTYRLEFRFSISQQYVENPVKQYEVNINISDLHTPFKGRKTGDTLKEEQKVYGQKLSALLFENTLNTNQTNLKDELTKAVRQAANEQIPLRLRIVIGPSAQELNSLHWELLHHPSFNLPITQIKDIWFSRYLMSTGLNWDQIHIRAEPTKPRAGIMVMSSPNSAINPLNEYSQAKQYLKMLKAEECHEINRQINQSHYQLLNSLEVIDVLHLICNVKLDNGKPHLISTCANNKEELLSKSIIREALAGRVNKPRLVILQPPFLKGKKSNYNLLFEIAPAFAEAGIACILTFQAAITRKSLKIFLESFYSCLTKTHGHIGAAVCTARQQLIKHERPDWSAPVLIARQKTTRIWYESGFDGSEQEKEKVWNRLTDTIIKRTCIPIVGPRVFQKIVGSRDRIATELADRFHYPMAHEERTRMTQVARYIMANYGVPVLNNQYDRVLGEFLFNENRDIITDASTDVSKIKYQLDKIDNNINEFIDEIGEVRFDQCITDLKTEKRNELEIFIRLADFNLPKLITTSTTKLLEKAIEMRTKIAPQSKIHPWRHSMSALPLENKETKYTNKNYIDDIFKDPIDDEKLEIDQQKNTAEVYHLFGENTPWYHRILSEDDFFKFLRSIQRKNPVSVPSDLAKKLITSNLLLLGFGLNDWDFRMLLQVINTIKQNTRRMNLKKEQLQIAVQIRPDEELVMDPYKAKEYLQKFLGLRDIIIYWGGEDEFIRELSEKVKVKETQLKQTKSGGTNER